MDEFVFEGFEPANTTPVPDILFDILLSKLSGAEVKVLLYIIRRTWGFKKQTDAISLSQLQNGITTREGKILDLGCGIKRRETICEALASLERKKCIFSRKEKTSYKDNATTVYGIYFKQGVVSKPDYPTEEARVGSFKTGLPVVSKPDQGGPVTGPGVVSKPDPQETVIQLNSYQETVIQGDTNSRASSDDATPTRSQLEEQIAFLQAQLNQYKQTSSLRATEVKGNTPPSDTPLTPAGRITTTQEPTFPQTSVSPENTEPHVLDNAIPEPPNRQKTGVAESQPVSTPTPSLEAPKTAVQTQEMPSSTQSVKDLSNQATEQQQQANGESPIATSTTKKSGKSTGGKGKGKKKDAEPVEPVPPPARPDSEMPYGVEKILAWGDYFRGYQLPESTGGTSRYVKAKKAAERWIRRGLTEKRFVTILRFMRGVKITLENDEEFRDKWWPENCPADVWHVEEQHDTMVLEINKLRALKSGQPVDLNSRRAAAEAAAATRQPANSLPPIPEGWTPPSKKVSGGMQSWQ